QAAITIRNARLFEQRRELQSIARDITRILDKNELLQKILSRSIGLLGCKIGSVALLNKATNQLQFQYAIGKKQYLSVPFGKGLIGTAAEMRKPVRVGNVKKDTRYIQHVAATRSELDVPMLIGDELIGVLNAESPRYNAFDEDSEELAVILAGQAAVAIYNAELFEQRRVLQEIARDLTTELDPDKLLNKILQCSLELLRCSVGSIAIWNKTTGTLEYKYGIGKEVGASLPVGRGLMTAAAQTRHPVRVGDVRKDSRYVEDVAETRSELDVPLLLGSELIGVLNAESSAYNAFSEDDEKLAMVLASQAAIALYNAELFQRTQERLEQRLNDLKALQDVYEAVGQDPLEKVLRLITERAVSLTSAQYGNLWLLERGRDELRFGVEVNLLASLPRRDDRIPVDEHSINGWVALTRQPYLCDDVTCDKHYQKILDNIRSELAVPLRHGERIIGTLNLESTKPEAFTEDHQRLLEALASQAAIAIDDARLYDRLNTLITVGQTLTGDIRPREDEVLRLIYDQAGKLMDTD
ncbi:MAG: GAF domain-containing protein, partial [Chloroflexi bacterium]|nr:GAF domain-containing protein [Chloroflexota bacterium]